MKTTLKSPIGILGGTFDPIHTGHIEIAEIVMDACRLQEIHFIPSKIPVHRATPHASPQQRLAMIQLAIQNHPGLAADNCELDRDAPSYMIDTIHVLQKKHPATPLCLILGKDAFLYLHHWLEWYHIIENSNLIIVNRQTYAEQLPDELAALLKRHETKKTSDLHEQLSGKIYQLQIPPINISASHIRYQLQQGRHPSHELPDAVYQYILKHKLYQEP